MKNGWLFLVVLVLTACGYNQVVVPPTFMPRKLDTGDFVLATWQKELNYSSPVKVYIEGDGAAFNAYGQPTADPTPKGTVVREIAFGDPSPNVVYMARPCQFNKEGRCRQKYWTTARFAPEVIDSMYRAVKQIAQGREVILIGFSGGGQVAGLIAATKPDLHVKDIITIGGNLDHRAWTAHHNVPDLDESLSLMDYLDTFCMIPQRHYVGQQDTVIPPTLMIKSLKQCYVHATDVFSVVGDASHDKGWESIYPAIWATR